MNSQNDRDFTYFWGPGVPWWRTLGSSGSNLRLLDVENPTPEL